MKRLFPLLFVLSSFISMAQVPNAINYQTIVRADDGGPVQFTSMDFKVSILQGSELGEAVYIEEHTVYTNGGGLASYRIGKGTELEGEFSEIVWGSAAHFIKIESRQSGSGDYNLMGVEEFVSVPYAFYAENTAASENMWQQDGNDLYYLNGNVGIQTDEPSEALTLGNNSRIQVSTTKTSLSSGAVFNLRWNSPDAKPGIHFQDESGDSKIALSAYEYESYPSLESPKFSIATANGSGDLVERLMIPFGEDEVDISISDANLKLTDGNTFQVGTESNSGLALYYSDVFIHGTKKMGIGDKDWEEEGTYGNAQLEIYRSNSNVELLVHDDAGTNEVGLHLRNGENDWKMTHKGDFAISYEDTDFFKITSDGDVGIDVDEPIAKLDVNGNINVSSGFAYLVGGEGKGSYLPVNEDLKVGDVIGMNPESGLLRKFESGDIYMGITASKAGFVSNYERGREEDAKYALVVSKGQIKANLTQLQLEGRMVSTVDGESIGVLLANGKIYLK